MFNSESCKFSSIENNCITAALDKKIQKREALKTKISATEESLVDLRNTTDFTDNIDAKIETLKSYLLLNNDLSFRKFKKTMNKNMMNLKKKKLTKNMPNYTIRLIYI